LAKGADLAWLYRTPALDRGAIKRVDPIGPALMAA
jgi:hypothetical protein